MLTLADTGCRISELVGLRVAITNETLARQLGLGQNPVGQRFRKEANPSHRESKFEIVGLVRDTKYYSPKEKALRYPVRWGSGEEYSG